jgi:hypothetical protein
VFESKLKAKTCKNWVNVTVDSLAEMWYKSVPSLPRVYHKLSHY